MIEGRGRLVVGVERRGLDRRVWLEEGAGWRARWALSRAFCTVEVSKKAKCGGSCYGSFSSSC